MARPIGDANNPRGRDQYAALAVFLDTDAGLTGLWGWAIQSAASRHPRAGGEPARSGGIRAG